MSDVQSLLDELARRIGHSVSLDDPHGRLLGHSSQDGAVDAVRVSAILARQTPPDVLAWEDEHGIATAGGPVRIPPNPRLAMSGRVCVPVRSGRSLLAYLWIPEVGHGVGEAAIATAVDTAGLLRPLLHDDRALVDADQLTGLDRALRDVLAGQGAGAAMTTLTDGAPQLRTAQICVSVLLTGEPAGDRVRRVVRELVRPNRAHVASCPEGEATVVLSAASTALDDAITDTVARLAEDGVEVAAGTSGPTTFGVEAVRRAREEAGLAARLAQVDPALPRHCHPADVALYRALPPAPADPFADLPASAGMLLDTLERYLDLAGDAQRTAQALTLHRTTLYYRLQRAATLLGADLTDGMTRTRLHLDLKARRLARAAAPTDPG